MAFDELFEKFCGAGSSNQFAYFDECWSKLGASKGASGGQALADAAGQALAEVPKEPKERQSKKPLFEPWKGWSAIFIQFCFAWWLYQWSHVRRSFWFWSDHLRTSPTWRKRPSPLRRKPWESIRWMKRRVNGNWGKTYLPTWSIVSLCPVGKPGQRREVFPAHVRSFSCVRTMRNCKPRRRHFLFPRKAPSVFWCLARVFVQVDFACLGLRPHLMLKLVRKPPPSSEGPHAFADLFSTVVVENNEVGPKRWLEGGMRKGMLRKYLECLDFGFRTWRNLKTICKLPRKMRTSNYSKHSKTTKTTTGRLPSPQAKLLSGIPLVGLRESYAAWGGPDLFCSKGLDQRSLFFFPGFFAGTPFWPKCFETELSGTWDGNATSHVFSLATVAGHGGVGRRRRRWRFARAFGGGSTGDLGVLEGLGRSCWEKKWWGERD